MRSYDMERVSMRRRGNDYLSLEVPGLAEKRPSLVHGDYIIARHAGSDARRYQVSVLSVAFKYLLGILKLQIIQSQMILMNNALLISYSGLHSQG